MFNTQKHRKPNKQTTFHYSVLSLNINSLVYSLVFSLLLKLSICCALGGALLLCINHMKVRHIRKNKKINLGQIVELSPPFHPD